MGWDPNFFLCQALGSQDPKLPFLGPLCRTRNAFEFGRTFCPANHESLTGHVRISPDMKKKSLRWTFCSVPSCRNYSFAGHLKFSPDMSGETGGFRVLWLCHDDRTSTLDYGKIVYRPGMMLCEVLHNVNERDTVLPRWYHHTFLELMQQVFPLIIRRHQPKNRGFPQFTWPVSCSLLRPIVIGWPKIFNQWMRLFQNCFKTAKERATEKFRRRELIFHKEIDLTAVTGKII